MTFRHTTDNARRAVKKAALWVAPLTLLTLSGCAIVPYPPGFHRLHEVIPLPPPPPAIIVSPGRVHIGPGWRRNEHRRHHHHD